MRSWQKKPPKGRSYPVRPSVLEAAVADAGITLPVELARIDSSKEAAAIPRFIEWAKGIEALDYHSPVRREHQHFKWAYPDAKR
jgi:uncharacterized protein YccT (UPF0319 family)